MDDVGAELPCYGEKKIQTPNIDPLVRDGTRFDRAFLTSSVCSPSRSVMITAMYQTSIGAHRHRSGRGTEKIHLPSGVKPVPVLLQRAGYHTCNGDYPAKGKRLGKTDSTYCDLIISGLVGLRPQAGDTVVVNPLLLEDTWDFFCLDGVPYHGRLLTILWDRTGERYQKGKGLRVFADGREIAASATLGRITGTLPEIPAESRSSRESGQ
jgi:hypothetical protein